MRPPDADVTESPTLAELEAMLRARGVDHVGVASAEVLDRARTELHRRLDDGFDAGMQFTFRNPERSTDPVQSLRGARSLLVAARSYAADPPQRPAGVTARVAQYAWTDHYAELRSALRAVADRLKAAGERATVCCDANGLVDREAAYSAGLGWYGKNANLMIPGAGSWFVLGSVITTAELAPAEQPVADGCGTCHRCLDACPTGAIVAPGVIDGARCLAWVLQRPGPIPVELRAAVGDRMYGCDDCQDACPPTVRFAGRHRRPTPDDLAVEAYVDVLDLLDADDDTLLERHGRWYIAGRDPRWLRRNALVILGNTAAADDPRVVAVLARYRAGADELLAEHATWASEQLGVLAGAAPR